MCAPPGFCTQADFTVSAFKLYQDCCVALKVTLVVCASMLECCDSWKLRISWGACAIGAIAS